MHMLMFLVFVTWGTVMQFSAWGSGLVNVLQQPGQSHTANVSQNANSAHGENY